MEITIKVAAEVAKYNYYRAIVQKQFDIQSRRIEITLYNQGERITVPAESGVRGNIKRADGKSGAIIGSVTESGAVEVLLNSWSLSVAGEMRLSVSIIDAQGKTLTSTTVIMEVQEAEYQSDTITVYVAQSGLTIGTYHIEVNETNYQFTTTDDIPAGGTVRFTANMQNAKTYDASGTEIEELPLTIGSGGTELVGTEDLNILNQILTIVSDIRANTYTKTQTDLLLSNKIDILDLPAEDNIPTLMPSGQLKDSGVNIDDVMRKTDEGADGNIMTNDGTGQAEDSGVAISDVMQKTAAGADGNIMTNDGTGQAEDSGVAISDIMQKTAGGADGNIMTNDGSGQAEDSGVAISDVMQKTAAGADGNIMTNDGTGQAEDSGVNIKNIVKSSITNAEIILDIENNHLTVKFIEK